MSDRQEPNWSCGPSPLVERDLIGSHGRIRAHRLPGQSGPVGTAPSYIDKGQLRRSERQRHRRPQYKGWAQISVISCKHPALVGASISSSPSPHWSPISAGVCSSRRRGPGACCSPGSWLTKTATKAIRPPSPARARPRKLGSEGFGSTGARMLQSSRSAAFPVQSSDAKPLHRPPGHQCSGPPGACGLIGIEASIGRRWHAGPGVGVAALGRWRPQPQEHRGRGCAAAAPGSATQAPILGSPPSPPSRGAVIVEVGCRCRKALRGQGGNHLLPELRGTTCGKASQAGREISSRFPNRIGF